MATNLSEMLKYSLKTAKFKRKRMDVQKLKKLETEAARFLKLIAFVCNLLTTPKRHNYLFVMKKFSH